HVISMPNPAKQERTGFAEPNGGQVAEELVELNRRPRARWDFCPPPPAFSVYRTRPPCTSEKSARTPRPGLRAARGSPLPRAGPEPQPLCGHPQGRRQPGPGLVKGVARPLLVAPDAAGEDPGALSQFQIGHTGRLPGTG